MKRKTKTKKKSTTKIKPKKKYNPLKKVKTKDIKIISKICKTTGRKPLNIKIDLERSAKIKGRRTSKWGNIYYEYRKNRTDKNPKENI